MARRTSSRLNSELEDVIAQIGRKKNLSRDQVLRRSLALLKYLDEEGAEKVQFRSSKGEDKEVVLE